MTEAVPSPETVSRRRRAGLELMRQQGEERPVIRLLSSFNLDLLPAFLVEALDRAGVPADVHVAPFGQVGRELLDPASELYATAPASVLLVPAPEDVLMPLFDKPTSALSPEAAEALVEERIAELEQLVQTVVDRMPSTTVYVVALGTDRVPLPSALDPEAPERRQQALERFTAQLRKLSSCSPRVIVVDWDWHVRRIGWAAVRDDRLWYLGRMRLNPTGCAALAELLARTAAAYAGRVRKVLALDFDGLLWGGIVGEVGLKGLQLGEDGVGSAFQDVQRELVKLHDVGLLLVACSRNNAADALEVFERHPGMVLRREHLAAERINWQDKATNLRELADELSLGLESFVFLDDNPVERSWVRQACPEVLVPEVPDDPADRPAFLRAAPWFDRIASTEADRGRAASYQEQRHRRKLQQTVGSFEEFLASLEQEASIEPVHDGTLARAAQLCQRTNQFNLTTKRYTAADLEQLTADEDVELYTLAVKDRFGDSGITGLAILQHEGDETRIDTLLMSCRILGRKLEDLFLAFLAERAAARGSRGLVGRFEPTERNGQAASFYSDRGFQTLGDGAYRLDLQQHGLEPPREIRLTVTSDA